MEKLCVFSIEQGCLYTGYNALLRKLIILLRILYQSISSIILQSILIKTNYSHYNKGNKPMTTR